MDDVADDLDEAGDDLLEETVELTEEEYQEMLDEIDAILGFDRDDDEDRTRRKGGRIMGQTWANYFLKQVKALDGLPVEERAIRLGRIEEFIEEEKIDLSADMVTMIGWGPPPEEVEEKKRQWRKDLKRIMRTLKKGEERN